SAMMGAGSSDAGPARQARTPQERAARQQRRREAASAPQ
ncbi:MAG: hypothetical protein JWP65_2244, partial [Ramlibacter sp.]|nr:hypothetical protein [Ramlibacter sp.]